MNGNRISELVRQAKGEDRSLREYARDSGVDAAIISKIIGGSYLPKKPGIYEALTSLQAAPRGGVSFQQLIEAAGTSDAYQNGLSAGISAGIMTTLSAMPSSVLIRFLHARGIPAGSAGAGEVSSAQMKPEEVRKAMQLRSEAQRFAAAANGIIFGSLGKNGLGFRSIQTEGVTLETIRFDTRVNLINHEVSDYLFRYAFLSEEEAGSLRLAENTLHTMVEELVFLEPVRERKISIVTNHSDAYESLCRYRDRISFNGELSVILFRPETASLVKEAYLSHYISEPPVQELLLV